jgi:hypothetical protein
MILTSFGDVKHTKGPKDCLIPQHMCAIRFSEWEIEFQRAESDLRKAGGWGKVTGQLPTTQYHPSSPNPITKQKSMVLK